MAEKTATPPRPDGRRQFLTVMDPAVIRELKKVALDEGRAAYEVVEDAVKAYLAAQPK